MTHGARPLGQGTVAVDVSAGGPITELFGANIPLPLSSVGAAVGLDDRTDLHGAMHTTAAALFGLPAGEVGVSRVLRASEGRMPRVSVDGTLVAALGDQTDDGAEGGGRVLVQPTALAAWDLGTQRAHTVYAGVGALVEPWPTFGAYGWLLGGGRWALGGPAVGLVTEVKWLQPYASNAPPAPEYTGVAGQGAVSVQLGLDVRFGGAP
jgi:hypothetical protein